MAESLSKITAVFETAKELTMEAAASARNATAIFGEDGSFRPRDVQRYLNSRHEKEKLVGMKAIATLMSKGEDVTEFFPDVVKNSAAQTLEVRKLVYIYLLRYAQQESDLALLSINAIQKSLGDQNPQIRAMAIKVLSGIKVPSIAPIVLLGIRKSIVDMSSVVRRAAAVAIGKAYELDKSNLETLVGYLATLLADKSFYVIGSAVQTFVNMCPDRLDMLHTNYRRYCNMLADIEEWGQVCVLDMLTRYVRIYVPKGRMVKKPNDKFYSDDEENEKEVEKEQEEFVIDPDLEMLLAAAKPLLQSRNSAVVLAVVNLFNALVPEADLSFLGPPLVRLLSRPSEIQYVVLSNIAVLAIQNNDLFAPYLKYFYVFPSDTPEIAKRKIEVLTLSCSESTVSEVLSELQYYATSVDKFLVAEAVRAIGRCAQISNDIARRCLRWLLKQIHSADPILVGESLTVIRYIIQLSPKDHIKTVAKLALALDSATVPLARASIIWLVGEFAGIARYIAPDVLRKCAKGFMDEDETTKLQIVLLSAKLYSYYIEEKPVEEEKDDTDEQLEPTIKPPADPMDLLFDYIMLLARYDTSYDLRDRARLYKSLLASPSSAPLAKLLLQAPKPSPHAPSPSQGKEKFLIGSSGLICAGVNDGRPLPPWSSETPDASIRDEVKVEEAPVLAPLPKKVKAKTNKAKKETKKKKVVIEKIKHVKPKTVKKTEEDFHTTLDEFFGEPAATSAPAEEDEEVSEEVEVEVEEEESESEVEVIVEVSDSSEEEDSEEDSEEEISEDEDEDEDENEAEDGGSEEESGESAIDEEQSETEDDDDDAAGRGLLSGQ
ncbi:adaptin N terminal region-domain-containing protein [Lipomyces tetrasporus]|uniref:Adaptin N terminal region-domain-containing protein n=1 Tax=Lipomyces tetrasporus TaxID=54092 RepID=A0AAD7VR68_9ASCO|nr:adaptin N terminal region-domain-containing protein [Lipomyces tetrasporus]KAJ8099637.1 adaptin N terminal region-domain-containing protein [Lipomyces tetrasporus]